MYRALGSHKCNIMQLSKHANISSLCWNRRTQANLFLALLYFGILTLKLFENQPCLTVSLALLHINFCHQGSLNQTVRKKAEFDVAARQCEILGVFIVGQPLLLMIINKPAPSQMSTTNNSNKTCSQLAFWQLPYGVRCVASCVFSVQPPQNNQFYYVNMSHLVWKHFEKQEEPHD